MDGGGPALNEERRGQAGATLGRLVAAKATLASAPVLAKLWLVLAAVGAVAVLAVFLFLAFLGALAGGQASGATLTCGVSGKGRSEIPSALVPKYEAASSRYRLGERGVAVLAAINKIETGFGKNQGPSSAGARGWMQFMPATWAMYGVDGDGDGRRDPANPDDAIHAAARYLRASGAPRSWYRAIYAYNHADWYVRKVEAQADAFQGACTATADPSVSLGDLDFNDTAGAWGGSRKFARALARPGRRYGCVPTSEKRPRKSTASGGISDHWVGSRLSYAIDIDSASCTMTYPGGEADRTARAIAAALGMPRHTGIVSTVRGAYRFQLIWQTDGHYNHPHIGVKRVGG